MTPAGWTKISETGLGWMLSQANYGRALTSFKATRTREGAGISFSSSIEALNSSKGTRLKWSLERLRRPNGAMYCSQVVRKHRQRRSSTKSLNGHSYNLSLITASHPHFVVSLFVSPSINTHLEFYLFIFFMPLLISLFCTKTVKCTAVVKKKKINDEFYDLTVISSGNPEFESFLLLLGKCESSPSSAPVPWAPLSLLLPPLLPLLLFLALESPWFRLWNIRWDARGPSILPRGRVNWGELCTLVRLMIRGLVLEVWCGDVVNFKLWEREGEVWPAVRGGWEAMGMPSPPLWLGSSENSKSRKLNLQMCVRVM